MRYHSYFSPKMANLYADFVIHRVALREGNPLPIHPGTILSIATLDELPQADISDLVRAYWTQRTIDQNYEES
jgi:hypothetical protein